MRKGRENYLCLLNLEDAVNTASGGFMNQTLIPLGLIARWAKVTDDGDIQGGDLPGWLSELYGGALITASPTAAGSASTPPARIIAAASWSTRSAAPAPPNWWSPITRWS